jgi:integrase
MPTLRKRNNLWQVQIRVKGHPAESRSFPRRSDAKAWGEEREEQLKGVIGTAGGHTLRDCLDKAPKGKATPGILATFAKRCESHGLGLLELPVTKITKLHWQAYRAIALETQQPQSFNRNLKPIRAALKWAVREFNLPRSIVTALDETRLTVKPPKRKRRLHDHEEAILRAALCPKFNAVLTLLLETGMRVGELCKLQRSWIVGAHIHLPAWVTKTNTSRTVTLSPRGIAVVDMLKAQAGAERLFTDRTGKDLLLKIKKAGLVDFHVHDLRHEALSRMADMGLSPHEMMAQSGHTQLSQLGDYIHSSPIRLQRKLAQLAQSQQSEQLLEARSLCSDHPHSSTIAHPLSVGQPTLELVG